MGSSHLRWEAPTYDEIKIELVTYIPNLTEPTYPDYGRTHLRWEALELPSRYDSVEGLCILKVIFSEKKLGKFKRQSPSRNDGAYGSDEGS